MIQSYRTLGLSNELLFLRGCKTVTYQSWRSDKIALCNFRLLSKKWFNSTQARFFLDIQLWKVTVLQPFELWLWIVGVLCTCNVKCFKKTIELTSFIFSGVETVLPDCSTFHRYGKHPPKYVGGYLGIIPKVNDCLVLRFNLHIV